MPQCDDCIVIEGEYAVITLVDNKGSDSLIKWYNNVFSKQNPGMAGDFDFIPQELEGAKMVDVLQHNYAFTFQALMQLYDSHNNREVHLSDDVTMAAH